VTRPRPKIEIGEGKCGGEYNGILEIPKIILKGNCSEIVVGHIITHETIHWVLHKRLGEDTCHLFDRIIKSF